MTHTEVSLTIKTLMVMILGSQPSWYCIPPVNCVLINSYRSLTPIFGDMGLGSMVLNSASLWPWPQFMLQDQLSSPSLFLLQPAPQRTPISATSLSALSQPSCVTSQSHCSSPSFYFWMLYIGWGYVSVGKASLEQERGPEFKSCKRTYKTDSVMCL